MEAHFVGKRRSKKIRHELTSSQNSTRERTSLGEDILKT